MTSRALICVLLLVASSSVVARESHLAGPGGGGGGGGNGPQQCQEIDSAVAEATAKAPAKPRVTKTSTQPVRATKPAKVTPTVRGDSDAASDAPRVTTPRWHSFLPGMFR